MTARSVIHATFVLDRVYPASPSRVFNAFADPKAKAKWFAGPPEWGPDKQTMDFRVGGQETSVGGPNGGPQHAMYLTYYDIIPDERLVYAYEMQLDGKRISVSVATIELTPTGKDTRLKLTEQGAYLDGFDNGAQREAGTKDLLDSLGKSLA